MPSFLFLLFVHWISATTITKSFYRFCSILLHSSLPFPYLKTLLLKTLLPHPHLSSRTMVWDHLDVRFSLPMPSLRLCLSLFLYFILFYFICFHFCIIFTNTPNSRLIKPMLLTPSLPSSPQSSPSFPFLSRRSSTLVKLLLLPSMV